MPYFDPDEEDEVQECTTEMPDSAIKQLAVAIQRLADTNIDRTLFGNFWLNEIKSLDDTIRLITNINILLLAAYSTIIVTNFETISVDILASSNSLHHAENLNLVIICSPIISWIFSISISSNNHNLPPQNAEPLLDIKKISPYFIDIYEWKKYIQTASYVLTFLGIGYLMIMLFLSIVLKTLAVFRSNDVYYILLALSVIFLYIGFRIQRDFAKQLHRRG